MQSTASIHVAKFACYWMGAFVLSSNVLNHAISDLAGQCRWLKEINFHRCKSIAASFQNAIVDERGLVEMMLLGI